MMHPSVSSIPLHDLPLWDRMADRRAIFSFDIELTARCMNDCRHCYVNVKAGDRAARVKELSRQEISRIADEAIAQGALWCLLTGGEPLLREDFCDIYLSLKRKGLLVSVFTTAQVLTDEHVRLFRQYPPRAMEITVYGVTRETYERVTRQPGSFAAFSRGLDRLLGADIKVRLKAMALRSNRAELPEIARFSRQRTQDYFRLDPFLHLRVDGDHRRNGEIVQERLSAQEIVAIEQADEDRSKSLRKKCNELITPDLAHLECNHLLHCGAGKGNFFVSYDGKLRLCPSLCHPECIYDLRAGSVEDAWRNFVPRVQEMRSSRMDFLEGCHRCPVVNLCFWCPATAHLETGELDGSVEYFCEVAHARAHALRATT
jgi:radical SAM protein with 4Fe4S-binding SPASM domain